MNQIREEDIREQLQEISNIIRKSKKYWRFNYSVGFANGSCYSGNYEDENKLKCKKK